MPNVPKMTLKEREDLIIFWSSYCLQDKVYEVLTTYAEQNAQ